MDGTPGCQDGCRAHASNASTVPGPLPNLGRALDATETHVPLQGADGGNGAEPAQPIARAGREGMRA